MTSTIIELREKDALNQNTNGDWESVVQDKIVLEDGDSVVMHSCFVDTEATSNQKIVIDRPITLDLEWIYFVNANIEYNTTAKPDQVINSFDATGTPAFSPDYKQYYMTHPKNVSGNYASMTQIKMEANPFDSNFPSSGKLKGFSGTISYVTLDGETKTCRYTVPDFQYVPIYSTDNVANLPNAITFKLEGGSNNDNIGITYISPTYDEIKSKFFYLAFADSEEGTEEIAMSPEFGKTSIEFPSGSYSPVQLCNFLNTELTKSAVEGTSLYGNQFLQDTDDSGTDQAGFSTQVFTENGTGITGFRAKNPYSFLYGANTVEFTYLDSQQLFAIDQIHTSMFDSSGSSVVSYLPSQAKVLTSYSQIAFTHLSATDKNGDNFDFWEGKLGFDLSKLIPVATLAPKNGGYMSNPDVNFTAFTFNTEAGVNTTEDLASIDGLVDKSSNFYEPIGEVNATSEVNTRIVATNSVFNKADQFGYFLIEVKANMGGNFVSHDANIPSIRAVVSRFYELNAYVSGTEGDSVIYTHRGQPVFLDSFKCRVLDSSKNLATNIGDDNTIFLQVIKAEKKE